MVFWVRRRSRASSWSGAVIGGAAIDDEEDQRGAIDRNLGLFENLGGISVSSPGTMPPVSTTSKVRPFHVGRAVYAIASDSRLVGDDGAALSDDSIEQRGFSDIRPADDGDQRQWSS